MGVSVGVASMVWHAQWDWLMILFKSYFMTLGDILTLFWDLCEKSKKSDEEDDEDDEDEDEDEDDDEWVLGGP